MREKEAATFVADFHFDLTKCDDPLPRYEFFSDTAYQPSKAVSFNPEDVVTSSCEQIHHPI